MPTLRERCRQIFGNAKPVQQVWEKEFDYNDKALRKLACKDWSSITSRDLGAYYVLNLIYVEPLQPTLFNYLFPICLAAWGEELLENTGSYFSDEIYRAFKRPYLWQQMMSEKQRESVYGFLVDIMTNRLKAERGFLYNYSITPAYTWFYALENLGECLPLIEPIWNDWWQLDHPGKAVSALMYATCLIYWENENPVFPEWTQKRGGGPPCLKFPALNDNACFLKGILSAEFIISKSQQAAHILKHEPEGVLASQIASDARQNRDIITLRIETLE